MYSAMITDFVLPNLNGIDMKHVWLQKDEATCRPSHATNDLLCQTFEGRLISRNGNVNWPPRSSDWKQLDYFLWGAMPANYTQLSIWRATFVMPLKRYDPLCSENWTRIGPIVVVLWSQRQQLYVWNTVDYL